MENTKERQWPVVVAFAVVTSSPHLLSERCVSVHQLFLSRTRVDAAPPFGEGWFKTWFSNSYDLTDAAILCP